MKGYKLRIYIYVAAFLLTATLTYLFKISNIISKSENKSMTSAGLPVLYMVTDIGNKYNYLTGHLSDVNYAEMHGVVTPIGTDRNLQFAVKTYGTNVTGVSYEVRSLDGKELIEKNTVKDFEETDSNSKLNIKLRNLIIAEKEYMLVIKVSTNIYEDASYYTRIVLTDKANVDKKINYVKRFSRNTQSEETLKEVISKLEPDSTGDNTNLGHVNIHCKLSQVGFGKLNPTQVGEVYTQIDEIDGNVASITLKYTMTTNDNDVNNSYKVTEFYRINQVSDDVTYVYSFDRFIDQKFTPENAVTSSGNIYLGISPTDERHIKINSTGTVMVFVEDGILWSYHPNRDRFNKVFSFDEETSDDYRESNQNFEIKITNVDKNGNIYFLVYGYMNRGIHEGQNGIGAYYYNADKNTTEELVFIPSEESYKVLTESLNKIAFINDQNVLYFYQNRSIYYLNCETKECMLIDNDVIPSTCKMSDNNVLMYQTGNNENNCQRIKIIDLKSGSNKYIDCKTTERIKALGFIDNNIVYGLADIKTINELKTFAMKQLDIVDENNTSIRKYKIKDVYITATEFYNSKIVIKRAAFNEENQFVSIEEDQLLSNNDQTNKNVETKYITSEIRQKELYIKPVLSGSSKTNLQKTKYVFPVDSSVYINNEFDVVSEYFYVYAYGELYYINSNFEISKEVAKNLGGVVVNKSGDRIWDRYMDKKAS